MGAALSSGQTAAVVILALLCLGLTGYLGYTIKKNEGEGNTKLLYACTFVTLCMTVDAILLGTVSNFGFGQNLGTGILDLIAISVLAYGLFTVYESFTSGNEPLVRWLGIGALALLAFAQFPAILSYSGATGVEALQATIVMTMLAFLALLIHAGIRAYHFQQFFDRDWFNQFRIMFAIILVCYFILFTCSCVLVAAFTGTAAFNFFAAGYPATVFFYYGCLATIATALGHFSPLLKEVADDTNGGESGNNTAGTSGDVQMTPAKEDA